MTSLANAATEILARSGMTKSALCAKAKISRTSLDAYLKGTTVNLGPVWQAARERAQASA